MPEEFWDHDAAKVNAEIAKMWAKEKARLSSPVDGEVSQGPASYRYALKNGKMAAAPQSGDAIDGDTVIEILPELIDKAKQHYDLAFDKGGNHPQRILNNAGKLAALLEEWNTAPKLGTLLMRMRTLEADIVAFGASSDSDQLYPNEIASMQDLAKSCADLISLYPLAQKMQAAGLALSLQKQDVVILNQRLDEIEVFASTSIVVETSAKLALNENVDLIKNTSEIIETSSNEKSVSVAIEQRAEVTASRVLNFRNFGAELVRAAQDGVVGGVKDGVKGITSGTIKTGFALLVGSVAGPYAALAAFISSLKPVAEKAKEISEDKDDETMSV